MYQQPIMNSFNPQPAIDRINAQMAELERQKAQLQQPIQPTNLTQNFQLVPSNKEVIRYAESMEEVQRDIVIGDTPYFSKDMSVVWVKNTNNQIKTYELTEIAQSEGILLDDVEFVENYLDKRYDRQCHTAKTVGEFAAEYPVGIYLVTMENHITVVVDGTVFDIFDCRPKRMWCSWKVSD